MNQEKAETSNLSISIFNQTGGEGSHDRHPLGFGAHLIFNPEEYFRSGFGPGHAIRT
nr:MAG TPA: hypothetical protein [Caudoviricetes sp.]